MYLLYFGVYQIFHCPTSRWAALQSKRCFLNIKRNPMVFSNNNYLCALIARKRFIQWNDFGKPYTRRVVFASTAFSYNRSSTVAARRVYLCVLYNVIDGQRRLIMTTCVIAVTDRSSFLLSISDTICYCRFWWKPVVRVNARTRY